VDICGAPLGEGLAARAVLDTDRGVQPTVVAHDAGGTGDLDGDPSPFVRGRGADEQVHLARLDDAVQTRVSVGGPVGVDVEDQLGRRPRLEVDAGEADQL